jgi:hypothetical protein
MSLAMMKTIKTVHAEIGYTNNIEIIEQALKENFRLDDNSYVIRAVAAHIWSKVCGQTSPKQWTSDDVLEAIAACEFRLRRMTDLVNKQVKPATTPEGEWRYDAYVNAP